ncbi:MAG: hypothetical protein F6J87_05045 [Spirulina sp. SIO3F2]|nr:hypothetical protein [Spirulina sp. SIO3F2]
MEIILGLLLALLYIAIIWIVSTQQWRKELKRLLFWRKRKKQPLPDLALLRRGPNPPNHAEFHPTTKLSRQASASQAPLPNLGSLPRTALQNTDFGTLQASLEELAQAGWSTAQTTWSSGLQISPHELLAHHQPEQIIEQLLSHARWIAPQFNIPQMIPRVTIESMTWAAGQFEVDDEGWVTIRLSPRFFEDKPATLAILIHEVCHYILNNAGLRKEQTNENERLTDLCMFVCGFGPAFLNGYRRQPSQQDYRPGHRLGYLTDREYEFANQYVLELRASYQGQLKSAVEIKHNRLKRLLQGDDKAVKRVIAYERRQSPQKTDRELYEDAIARIENDRR